MSKINKNAQLKRLKQVEKDCKGVENDLKKLLREIETIERTTRDDEWKKNRQDCQERIKQVNEYYSDKIDILENKFEKLKNEYENEIELLKNRETEYERIYQDYSKKLMKLEDQRRQEEIREMNKNIGSWWKEHS